MSSDVTHEEITGLLIEYGPSPDPLGPKSTHRVSVKLPAYEDPCLWFYDDGQRADLAATHIAMWTSRTAINERLESDPHLI